MIIVTGTGRSGTSLLMEFLRKIGRTDIKGKWFEKANAGFEDPTFRNANYKILSLLKIKSTIQVHHEMRATPGFEVRFAKDPRFYQLCGNQPKLLDVWKMILPDIKFLITIRDFDKVYMSYIKTFNYSYERAAGRCLTIPQLQKSHNVFMSKMQELKIPHTTIKFPDFLDDFKMVQNAFGHFEYGIKDYHEKTWNELVKKDMVHF